MKGNLSRKAIRLPRKKKKAFKKWLEGVRGIFPDPTKKDNSAKLILEDLYSLFKNRNCLGKPLFRVGR